MTEHYDVVVIGGGIHGAGVAQAAAAAAHAVLLLERTAIAHGTSSRSSKLVHGGLRYLETLQFGLIRESLRERKILLRIAPGLVRLLPFHIPIYRHTSRRPWQVRAGLSIYALLGNLCREVAFRSIPRREWDGLDGLDTRDLQAVYRYRDAQTDDAALTRAVLASAEALGARTACPAAFSSAERADDGYLVRYRQDGADRECRCLALVNAAGPWARPLQEEIRPAVPGPRVELVQGAHILLDGRLEAGIYYVEAPRDRRAVFVMPWKESRILVGTTETPFAGDPDRTAPLPEEIAYLQETFKRHFPGREAAPLSSFSGLRVLPADGGSAFRRPREVIFSVDDRAKPCYVGIYGGKLTGYRSAAAQVMRMLRASLPGRRPVADTNELHLAE